MVKHLENDIDTYNAVLEPLRSFVMPGGNQTSALFHVARTIVRRAERRVWGAENTNPLVAQYLNRLSDLFFVMARFYNENEVLWQPGGKTNFEEYLDEQLKNPVIKEEFEKHPPKRFRDIGNAE